MKNSISVVVVDDEPDALELVCMMIDDSAHNLQIVGKASSVKTAVEAIEKHRPQLVFLDIQMPGMNGFEVLERIDPAVWPHIVFVTAYNEFAVRAFEVNAVDYILKPFDAERLGRTLHRVREQLSSYRGDSTERLLALFEGPGHDGASRGGISRIVVRETGRIRLIDASSVRWISGAGNLVELHLDSGSVLHRESLQSLEQRLDPRRFLRIHRSSIVRIDVIEELRPLRRGDHEVHLNDGTILKLSRSHLAELKKRL